MKVMVTDITLSVDKFHNKIRLHLKDIIINLIKSDKWKNQLTIAINFISSKDNYKEHVIYEVIENLFESLLNRYQTGLKTSMRGRDFHFDRVHLLYYKYQKINFKRVGWYIDSPDWMKTKKGTINPINEKENKCF